MIVSPALSAPNLFDILLSCFPFGARCNHRFSQPTCSLNGKRRCADTCHEDGVRRASRRGGQPVGAMNMAWTDDTRPRHGPTRLIQAENDNPIEVSYENFASCHAAPRLRHAACSSA